MSNCVKSSDQFTYAEWKANQMNVLLGAELDRASAERLTNETKRYIDEMRQASQHSDQRAEFSQERRMEEVRYWQNELNMKLDQIKLAINDLSSIDRRLDKAMDSIKENCHIVHKCLEARKRRKRIYLVYDPAEKQLCKEREIIEGVLALHCKTKSQVNDQLRLLRKLRHDIEKDVLMKLTNFDVEMESSEIRAKKAAIAAYNYDPNCEGAELCPCKLEGHCCQKTKKPGGLSSISDWLTQVKSVHTEAEKQRQNAANLTSIADSSLKQTKDDLQNIKVATDDAFRERIYELRDHKAKMEDHLQKVVKQIQEMETTSQSLINEINIYTKKLTFEQSKIQPLQNCPQNLLDSEEVLVTNYCTNKGNVEKLKDNLACVQCSLKSLQCRKVEVESDLKLCTEALTIDDYECLPMRQSIKYFLY
ncbi:hypothetical protein HELRODRAFT_181329 [Helobdella robusta]|uniref:Tektin n=1 Tax=Helobdella robusta TaxID=6412 RepID=T1FGW4_HELRO|nr:hypothetical protein HELRODRAFT_181329 [Helobdella robusta]ESN92457.1 hypothetical protein HELRODRAFT_181329 [Helobdella robusta]